MASKDLGARALAAEWLDQVLYKRRPLDEAMATGENTAEARDRAFAQLLCLTVLRRLGQIDDVIRRCLERALPRRARGAQLALRLGAAQLLFLDTPPHAAVDTSVDLAVARGDAGYRKLVNAVLRRLDREGRAWPQDQDAARLNTPDWLWESWSSAYGEANARAIAGAHLKEPPLDITAKHDTDAAAGKLEATLLPTGSIRQTAAGRISDLPGFHSGDWWVQDAAAAIPAKLLNAGAGDTVLDLCAAPGGKTAQLAATGAHVVAVDRSPARLTRLQQNLDRLGLTAELVEADGARWQPEEPASLILLDAPCTATGTIRRHPDIQYLKSPDDAERTADVQNRLLGNAAEMLRENGTLVYAVCSLQPEEGVARVESFLSDHANFIRVPIDASEVGGIGEAITPAGDLRTLPSQLADRGGWDGFYAARLTRLT